MSRFRRTARIGRRPDHWDSPHERARMRVAEQMSGDIGPDESAWLDEHLTDCAACTSVAAQYAADRDSLRAFRDTAPEPPRDLWARTAAAIEQEAGARQPATARDARRASRIPLGALSGIAVIALVVGVSTLSGSINIGNPTTFETDKPSDRLSTTGGEDPSGPIGPQATPFAVGAGAVRWVDQDANGKMALNRATIDEVCPSGTSSCAALDRPTKQQLTLDARPRTIIGSPTDGQAVVISDDAAGRTQLLLVDLPGPTTTPTTRSAAPAATPTETPTATDSASPSAGFETPLPSAVAASSSPETTPGVDTSAGTSSPSPATPSPSPSLSASPAVAASLAIASDIELVGESAAFSADGAWFAFTARPADGSRGPDVYIWRVGDESARALTTDGSTVFASWDGGLVVASRPEATPSAGDAVAAVTIHIDPATSEESPAGDMWRPVVDPTRSRAIGWSGSIGRSDDASAWGPETGTLELRGWTTERGAVTTGNGQGRDAGRFVTDAASAGFDVRWDESGEWVAIWVADPVDHNVGRLSLYRINEGRDRLELLDDAPTGVPALPGFSIGHGRLAWATPPGQDGEGSRIQIVAWNDDGVGTTESAPGEDLVVIR